VVDEVDASLARLTREPTVLAGDPERFPLPGEGRIGHVELGGKLAVRGFELGEREERVLDVRITLAESVEEPGRVRLGAPHDPRDHPEQVDADLDHAATPIPAR
jgi:hypothetical protein